MAISNEISKCKELNYRDCEIINDDNLDKHKAFLNVNNIYITHFNK